MVVWIPQHVITILLDIDDGTCAEIEKGECGGDGPDEV